MTSYFPIALVIVAIVTFGLFFSSQSSFGQTELMTISTDKQTYTVGEFIVVTGKINLLLSEENDVRLIIFDPSGTVVSSSLIEVGKEREFYFTFNSGISKLNQNGVYLVQAIIQGLDESLAKTIFELTEIENDEALGGTITVQNTAYKIPYTIWGSTLDEVWADSTTNSLLFDIEADTTGGGIFVSLPRSLIDATLRGEEIDFIVHGYGKKVTDFEKINEYKEIRTPTDRLLTIEYPAETSLIEISGTHIGSSSYAYSPPLPSHGTLALKNTDYSITYNIVGGKIFGMVGFLNENYMLITISSLTNGELDVILPEEFNLPPFSEDGPFFVLVSGEEVEVEWQATEGTLIIPFTEGTKEIAITNIFPRNGQDVPNWIKETAQWWNDGLITDEVYLKGIDYLLDMGILQV